MKNKTLMSSGLVAALAAALPATIAAAGTTVQSDEASFVAAAGGAGLAFAYGEDFESYAISGGYNMLPSPWTSSVAPNLSMASGNNSNLFLALGAYYWASIPSNAMGTLENSGPLSLSFAGGVNAVGMDLYGTSTFIAGYFDDIAYTVFDTGGAVLASGNFAASGSTGAYFGVVTDSDLIGEIQIDGTRFGSLGSQQFADNIQAWVPAPSALAVLGLGGAFIGRRRR